MENQNSMELSSRSTTIGFKLAGILLLIMIPIFIMLLITQDIHTGSIVGGVLFLALIGFYIYMMLNICTAKVEDGKLVLKKNFKPAKTYSFNKIGHPTSFHIGKSKYTNVEMLNDDNKWENYTILNSRSMFMKKKDAQAILNELRAQARRNVQS